MANISVGIVGLPNVGKSTLFEAITKRSVDRANYPFATIDPNVGTVTVPDYRVEKLAEFSSSDMVIKATVDFVDIAGLVEGASGGEGLGNRFLSHVRQVRAIVYVLRAFFSEKIINTRAGVDPLREKEILDTELALKDLETVNKRLESISKEIKQGLKEAKKEEAVFKQAKELLEKGKVLAEESLDEEANSILSGLQLLSVKPRIFLLNGKKDEIPKETLDYFSKKNYIVANLEEEHGASSLSFNERVELGLSERSRLDELISEGYKILNLITFFTTGQKETRAWTIKKGSVAPQAAGAIHSDFEQKFIRADVIEWQTLLSCSSWADARSRGLIRSEGKDYIVKDGDVLEIRHGA